MPILHRHVVPNVPALAADNGKIVFRAGKPSSQAEMRVSALLTATISLGSALTSGGASPTVNFSAELDDAYGGHGWRRDPVTLGQGPWGVYNDASVPGPASPPVSVVHKFVLRFKSVATRDLGRLTCPWSGYVIDAEPADQRRVPNPCYGQEVPSVLLFPDTWHVALVWDAALASARWVAYPDRFYLARIRQTLEWSYDYPPKTARGTCSGGYADVDSLWDARLESAPWAGGAAEKIRIGSGLALRLASPPTDLENIDGVDVAITLFAAYA